MYSMIALQIISYQYSTEPKVVIEIATSHVSARSINVQSNEHTFVSTIFIYSAIVSRSGLIESLIL